MKSKKISFRSYNNLHKINGEIFYPNEKINRIGVIQISHGMVEHIGRYSEFIDFLLRNGYVVAMHEHAGHGESVAEDGLYGYFGKNGDKVLVNDLHNFVKIVRSEIPDLPYFIFGHSMGSFVLRKFMSTYSEEKYNYNIKGFILCGTGGTVQYNNLGLSTSFILGKICGEKSFGNIYKKLTFDSYNREFEFEEGGWLTKDLEKEKYILEDPKGKFTFTYNGYNSLFKIIKSVSSKNWYKSLDKSYNTLIISGGDDVVGDFGNGPKEVYSNMLKAGNINTEIIIYPNARHELINEVNRYEIFDDILNWISKITRTC